MLYDVFISHASEDKDDFVEPLAQALRQEHIEVWYDDFSLSLGDSLRESIDKGLAQSRFGIIVFSHNFFNKNWPEYELTYLLQREMAGTDKIILPIWHNIHKSDIQEYSPVFAQRKAICSDMGLPRIVSAIQSRVRPQRSPLVVARDELIRRGITPPVITDPYWLDIVAASNWQLPFGAIPNEDGIWGRWSFPLHIGKDSPEHWGKGLAFSAMQLRWVEYAEANLLSPVSSPTEVLEFLSTFPGLLEVCERYPELTAEYAPQLTIRGFGGFLEQVFEQEYQYSLKKYSQNYTSGSALTSDGEPPHCDETWALRHPTFGDYEPEYIAYEYFNGGMFGPCVSPFEEIDHILWLLSANSSWLPEKIHQFLLAGMEKNTNWPWDGIAYSKENSWKTKGALERKLRKCIDENISFIFGEKELDDLTNRVMSTKNDLQLPESVNALLRKFIELNIIESYIMQKRRKFGRKTKRKGKKK